MAWESEPLLAVRSPLVVVDTLHTGTAWQAWSQRLGVLLQLAALGVLLR